MASHGVSGFLIGLFLATAASAALMPSAARAEYDTDAILMAGPTEAPIDQTASNTAKEIAQIQPATGSQHVAEMADQDKPIIVAQAQTAPATATPDVPYSNIVSKAPAPAAETATTAAPAKSPVDYAADTVDYDQEKKLVILKGHVEVTQEGRKLEADTIHYNLKDDIAVAEGNVVIHDVNGDVHHAQSVELSDKMRKGLVNRLFTTMNDGSRVWGSQGVKESEMRYELKDAQYTACKACAKDPDKRPPWSLHAKEVELRKDEHRVVYRNAWLDLGGVPVLYTPYFSHPDGTIQQKSGFLTPSFGFNSNLGFFYSQPYYWAISPSTDATVSVMPTTEQGPLLRGEFRKRFENGYIQTDSSITNSSRTDSIGNLSVDTNDEVRGHLFADGKWDMTEHWRSGVNLRMASDEQYLRQYGFSDESVLENRIFAERFEGRNYALVEGMAFQDIRAGAAKSDQPNILPYVETSFLGDPNAMLGGRWEWDSSLLSLARDGNGQDMWRVSSTASWKRRDIVPLGLVFDSELAARGDGFVTTNRIEHSINPSEPKNQNEGRFIPSAQFTASYPMKRNYSDFQLRVEPVATLYAAPAIDNDNSIPNEDSTDVQLDVGNLLEGNRFPGLDRVEDRSHVAYGLKTGLYSYQGGHLATFLGQSYNFDDTDNPFPVGSGLDKRSSDYVGSVDASFDGGKHDISYRFEVDSDTLASQRHELYARTEYGPVEVDGTYLYAHGVAGTPYAESREQLRLGSTISLSDAWSARGDGIYDLSSVPSQRGLRRAIGTLTYTHECYNVAMTVDRNLADETSGVQDTTVMFRIGLKNLGEYTTKAFQLQGAGDQ